MKEVQQHYRDVLEQVTFRDWRFVVEQVGAAEGSYSAAYYLVIEFDAPCSSTRGPAVIVHRGRKWLLSPFMLDGELVQTAFMAVMAALEHEAREDFNYKQRAILGPHYDPEILVAVCETGHGDVRRRPPPPPDSPRKGVDHDGVLQGINDAATDPRFPRQP